MKQFSLAQLNEFLLKNNWIQENKSSRFILYKPPSDLGFSDSYRLSIPISENFKDIHRVISDTIRLLSEVYEVSENELFAINPTEKSLVKYDVQESFDLNRLSDLKYTYSRFATLPSLDAATSEMIKSLSNPESILSKIKIIDKEILEVRKSIAVSDIPPDSLIQKMNKSLLLRSVMVENLELAYTRLRSHVISYRIKTTAAIIGAKPFLEMLERFIILVNSTSSILTKQRDGIPLNLSVFQPGSFEVMLTTLTDEELLLSNADQTLTYIIETLNAFDTRDEEELSRQIALRLFDNKITLVFLKYYEYLISNGYSIDIKWQDVNDQTYQTTVHHELATNIYIHLAKNIKEDLSEKVLIGTIQMLDTSNKSRKNHKIKFIYDIPEDEKGQKQKSIIAKYYPNLFERIRDWYGVPVQCTFSVLKDFDAKTGLIQSDWNLVNIERIEF